MQIKRIAILLFCAPLGIWSAGVSAQVTITKVADTNTLIPGGSDSGQPFNSFEFSGPALDHGNVFFAGGLPPESDQFGLYTLYNGTLRMLRNTAPFDAWTSLMIRQNYFAYAFGPRLQDINGNMINLFNGGVPGTGTPFAGGIRIAIDGQNAWFEAQDQSGGDGIYQWNNGSLTTIAQTGAPDPALPGQSFREFNTSLSGDQGNVAFRAGSTPTGQPNAQFVEAIYKRVNGTLQTVAVSGSSAPGGTGTFLQLSTQALGYDGQTLAFLGSDTARGGALYEQQGNQPLQAILSDGSPAPGGGTFHFNGGGTDAVSVDAGHIAFEAFLNGPSTAGIFTDYTGTLSRVIGTGDQLFGKTVELLAMGQEGLSGDEIAFYASFTDGSSGIYIATLPEPSSLMFLLGIIAYAATRRAKRSKSMIC
jgi:hypothetical protein